MKRKMNRTVHLILYISLLIVIGAIIGYALIRLNYSLKMDSIKEKVCQQNGVVHYSPNQDKKFKVIETTEVPVGMVLCYEK